MADVTQLLNAAAQGDTGAASQILPLVYAELRRLAARRLAREEPGQTLEPTALVHEAYLRLVHSRGQTGEGEEAGDPDKRGWDGRGHFFAAAAEAMRRILVDRARRKRRPKHGGDRPQVDVDLDALAIPPPPVDVLALDEALTRLAQEAPARAELVKLRFFAGLTMPEAAQALGVSLATAERHWKYARAWLYAELTDASD
jgi:RNA polymerase sigma factor (TIGR02999 family)